ncbi:MAG: TetR/AcrR family transcriptional regulator [Burkholderiaceae bacterium]|nr:TetR/AcrR family transcriptional regulator [Burkholderiaceae bacterium]
MDESSVNVLVRRTPRKRAQSVASIEKILDSALELMVSRGFNATTVDDIAHKVGLTKGAVYFHFENKTAILMALLDIIEKLLIGGLLERVMGAGPSSRDRLVAALHNQGLLAGSKTKYLLLFTLILLEFNGTGDEIETRVRRIYDNLIEEMRKIVRDGLNDGDFDSTLDARELVAVIMALQHGTLMEWYCRSDQLNGQSLVRTARVVLLNGLLNSRSSRGKHDE